MNIVCSIFGHRKIIKDYYPHDPITTLACERCNKILKKISNPNYNIPTKRIISPNDPYGEEQWEI